MMNKNRLKSVMVLYGDNNRKLAEYLDISESRFSAKINETNGAEFDKSEIFKMKQKYNLSAVDIDAIFF